MGGTGVPVGGIGSDKADGVGSIQRRTDITGAAVGTVGARRSARLQLGAGEQSRQLGDRAYPLDDTSSVLNDHE